MLRQLCRKALRLARLLGHSPLLTLAWLWRLTLVRPLRVGVTGSLGKTTTKELLAAVLAVRGGVSRNRGSLNYRGEIARTLLRTRSTDTAIVMELGAFEPASLRLPLRLFKPQAGVVTCVKLDHYTAFRSLDAVAAEKARLPMALPGTGWLALNADDPAVIAMAHRTRARVVTYGVTSEAVDVRAENVTSRWPDPLSATVVCDGRSWPLRTKLYGAHWIHAVLAALAGGRAAGVPFGDALAAVATVPPFPGRYSPVECGGLTFVRDDIKAPWDSFPAALAFLKDARAGRRILIIGTISDYPGSSTPKYRSVARQAAAFCERVIVIGYGVRHRYDTGSLASVAERVRGFATVAEAEVFLRAELRAGDLVLVKGSTSDHLERISLGWNGGLRCKRTKCRRRGDCGECPLWLRTDRVSATGAC